MHDSVLAPFYDWFDRALEGRQPAVSALLLQNGTHLLHHQLLSWLQTVFMKLLPLATAARIWDVFLLEGSSFLFKTALAIVDLLAPTLLRVRVENSMLVCGDHAELSFTCFGQL
jgi:hypothetical protein